MLMVSVFALSSGHHGPGGGFLGGLVAGAGFALYAMAFGTATLRHAFGSRLSIGLGTGVLCLLAAATIGLVQGVFLRAVWVNIGSFQLGTPLLFDLGVYLVVASTVLTILLARPGSA